MKLIADWKTFKDNITSLIEEGNGIAQQFDTEREYEAQKEIVAFWHAKVLDQFYVSFDPAKNEFSKGLADALKGGTNRYQIPKNSNRRNLNIPKNNSQENREENLALKRNLEEVLKTLKFYLKFLSASDAIIQPQLIELEGRSTFTTEQILELLIDKLFVLYGTGYISIVSILEANGITLGRYDEEREMAKMLEKKGLVNVMAHRDMLAELTLKGKMYVEDRQKSTKPNYDKIDDNQTRFESTIDEILESLRKLGYGQEIIFDEITELKELHAKLSKKNFGQVLKGKLFDLGLSKAIENDTIGYIYEKITDEVLRLP